MDDTVIAEHLENLDHRLEGVQQILRHDVQPRLANIEQILPTLATKDELKALATKEDLKALATKEDLQGYATKEDLRTGLERLRLDVQILLEHQDSKLQIIAEHVLSLMPKPREQ
jgi:hypothetical protein